MTAIDSLKDKRPIFHSEDDFKFAFSEVLSQQLGNNYGIRLEIPQEIEMIKRNKSPKIARAPIDIIIIDKKENIRYPIELKYKTKKLETSSQDEDYKLTNQNATDIGRFSFRKDIYRIEQLVYDENKDVDKGYFIVITNDEKYLQDVSKKDRRDKNFSFHDGAILQKDDKSWYYEDLYKKGYILDDNKLVNNGKINWSSKGDLFYKLDLRNEYKIKWEKYSRIDDQDFYISIVEIIK